VKDKKNKFVFDPKAGFSKSRAGLTVTKFPANQIIYRQGEPANEIFYIQEGKLKLTVVSAHGKEAVVGVLTAGELVGEACVDGRTRRLSTATALTPCTCARITKTAFRSMIDNEEGFADFFISRLLIRSAQIRADLVDQLFNSSEKRLARVLLLLANFGKESEPEPVLANINQTMLAEMVGTTRSRVNVFMNKFRRLGFIDYDVQIEVHGSLLNMVLDEEPEIES
jgi:CRP-like cAMP-binding protein